MRLLDGDLEEIDERLQPARLHHCRRALSPALADGTDEHEARQSNLAGARVAAQRLDDGVDASRPVDDGAQVLLALVRVKRHAAEAREAREGEAAVRRVELGEDGEHLLRAAGRDARGRR